MNNILLAMTAALTISAGVSVIQFMMIHHEYWRQRTKESDETLRDRTIAEIDSKRDYLRQNWFAVYIGGHAAEVTKIKFDEARGEVELTRKVDARDPWLDEQLEQFDYEFLVMLFSKETEKVAMTYDVKGTGIIRKLDTLDGRKTGVWTERVVIQGAKIKRMTRKEYESSGEWKAAEN